MNSNEQLQAKEMEQSPLGCVYSPSEQGTGYGSPGQHHSRASTMPPHPCNSTLIGTSFEARINFLLHTFKPQPLEKSTIDMFPTEEEL